MQKDIKVVNWISWADAKNRKALVDTLALKDNIVERGIRRGAEWHQYSGEGVPLFNDGTVATFSWRAWGDLLAAIWAKTDSQEYSYLDFYWDDQHDLKHLSQRGKDDRETL